MTMTTGIPALRRPAAAIHGVRAMLAPLLARHARPAALDQVSEGDLTDCHPPSDPARWCRLNGTAQDAATRLQIRAGTW
jgi:hypothetical protein